jgi:transcriptional regulator with XRE-family HTH domain
MDSEHFIQLALEKLKCQQKDLAKRLDVSPAQVTKWKNGEYMSSEMEDKVRKIVQIGDHYPSVVVWTGSVEAANKWEKLVDWLAQTAADGSETGYDTYPLTDENKDMPHTLCWHTLYTLTEMGVEIPKPFPTQLDFDYGKASDEKWDLLLEENPYSALIYRIYKSLNDVWGFYTAYVNELVFDANGDMILGGIENIRPCLLELAASKLDPEPAASLVPNFRAFKYRRQSDYKSWLKEAQEHAFRAGVPIRAELMDMVSQPSDSLGVDAERESLGFNEGRLHPDIYMNELLTGMRVIHQVLPAILKKLGIGPDEFQLDASNLSQVSEPSTRRVEEDGDDDADEDGNDDPSTTAAEPKPRLLKQKEKGKPNA